MLQQYLSEGANPNELVPQVSYLSTPQYDQTNDSIPYQAPRPLQTPNSQPITFWSSDNIREYLKHLELTGFKNPNQRQVMVDRYKWISIKYDQDRDDQIEELNNIFPGAQSEEYEAKKDEIRWDIAWQIFDEVNEDVDSDQEIDLHGLDVEEAQAITK